MNTTVFVGGGRIHQRTGVGTVPSWVSRSDRRPRSQPEKTTRAGAGFGIAAEPDLQSAVARADMLIIAVRPAAVAKALDAIAGCTGAPRLLIVSLAAGIPLKKLRPRLGSRVRWARALPSPICRIGRGLTAVTVARNLPRGDRKRVRKFFEQVGPVLEMPESRFDAFNAAYSPGHGYHALATLAKAAQDAGLRRDNGSHCRAARISGSDLLLEGERAEALQSPAGSGYTGRNDSGDAGCHGRGGLCESYRARYRRRHPAITGKRPPLISSASFWRA